MFWDMSKVQKRSLWSLGQECPLEQEIAAHSVFLPGKLHGQKSQVGSSAWVR